MHPHNLSPPCHRSTGRQALLTANVAAHIECLYPSHKTHQEGCSRVVEAQRGESPVQLCLTLRGEAKQAGSCGVPLGCWSRRVHQGGPLRIMLRVSSLPQVVLCQGDARQAARVVLVEPGDTLTSARLGAALCRAYAGQWPCGRCVSSAEHQGCLDPVCGPTGGQRPHT